MAKYFKDIGVSEEAIQNISNGEKKVVRKVHTILASEIKKEPTVFSIMFMGITSIRCP